MLVIKNALMDSPISFTCSSDRDSKSRVTVTADRLGLLVKTGQTVIVNIRHHGKQFRVTFECNRTKPNTKNIGSTLKTTSWPRELPVPYVGMPIQFHVNSVVIVN